MMWKEDKRRIRSPRKAFFTPLLPPPPPLLSPQTVLELAAID